MPLLIQDSSGADPSPARDLDPRAKLILTLGFILGVNLLAEGDWPSLLGYLGLLWVVALMARRSPVRLMRRSLVAFPFILAAVAIPFVIPGEVVWGPGPLGLEVSREGVVRLGSILLKFWVAVQSVTLLTLVTRSSDILRATRKLGLPVILVSVISFMWRYLAVIGDEALRMRRARSARSATIRGKGPSILWKAKVTGQMVGSLCLRALRRSDRIHAAMLSRGYDGRALTLERFRMTSGDWVVVSGGIFLVLFALGRAWI